MARELKELAIAKPLDPYAGPALLSGFATGLVFHEAIGHRLEGERMGSRSEGHTFAQKIGQRILPPGVDVVDDPTLARHNDVPLHGSYHIDDEGVPAQRAELVNDGILKSFIMSRQLTDGFTRSTGHGRHERYQDPMARMANLVVTARGGRVVGRAQDASCAKRRRDAACPTASSSAACRPARRALITTTSRPSRASPPASTPSIPRPAKRRACAT